MKQDMINKQQFVREVARRAGFTIGDVKIILETMIDVFEETMLNGQTLNIGGWFRAYPTTIKAYKGWDGYRQKPIDVPESTRVIIKPKKRFWEMMNPKDSDSIEIDEEEIETDDEQQQLQ